MGIIWDLSRSNTDLMASITMVSDDKIAQEEAKDGKFRTST